MMSAVDQDAEKVALDEAYLDLFVMMRIPERVSVWIFLKPCVYSGFVSKFMNRLEYSERYPKSENPPKK